MSQNGCKMLEDYKIKVFAAVCEHRSFTKAAKALGISQPAVSQNIAELEKLLNVKLFERNGGETSLTEQGLTFSEYANQILYWCDSAESVFGLKGKLSSRTLRIKASEDVADYLLPRLLQSLYASVPGFSAEIFSMERESFAADVEICTSVTSPSLHESPYLLAELPLAMLASPINVKARSSSASGSNFQLPAAVWEPLFPTLGLALSTRVNMRSNSLELIKKTVAKSSDTIAIVPQFAALDELSSGELVKVDSRMLPGSLNLYFKPSDNFRNTRLCQLAQTMLRQICA